MNQREHAANELEKWWLELAQEQVTKTVPKAVDYGSDDLRDLGAWLAGEMGLEGADEGTLVQLGIVMYIRGKLARVASAIKDGRAPSRDTWFDLIVYPTMGLRALEVGAWPGVDLDTLVNETSGIEVRELRDSDWRTCCHTLKGLGHLKGCKAVVGDQLLCTCTTAFGGEEIAVKDAACPRHGDA